MAIGFKIIILFAVIKLSHQKLKSEKILTGIELIEKSGYLGEQHNVTTEDGYILNVFRIIKSPSEFSNKSVDKPVIFMLCALPTNSDTWLFRGPGRSLAMQLVDEGYDVWLGNFRGTTYGRSHIKLSPNDKKFWDYSFHEHGYYDVPASVDFILNITNQNSLIYIGMSMGTTSIFITLSERPEYNSKIQLVICFCPVTGLDNKPYTELSLVPMFIFILSTIDSTGSFETIPQSPIYSFLIEEICRKHDIVDLCMMPLDVTCGKNREQTDTFTLSLALKYFPAGTSGKTFLHYGQFVLQKNGFRKFDYGNIKNIQHYGKSKPPKYNLKNVKSPMLFFYGENDPLSTARDTEEIIKKISSKVIAEPVPHKAFNHLDFVLAKDVKKLLNDRITLINA
ncbi:lipase 3-like [Aphidius gifuensis]|uniref:lipase 3-like n=1 Tax=Aphidius gifuensis TaxID=684658 RepID=UPI001CDBF580|nr:lipase 3-like [Aphidius gifuensis]